ncbi:MAG: hypothetical protein P8046_11340, partial [Anaerolineales bacterium]
MRRNQLLILGATLIMFLSAFFAAQSAQAQEPICPPGFAWQRMSGVGCVQNNCLEIADAKYSYTQACICLDGYKGCYQQVDYSGFDQSQCGPNCPVSELTSCVAPDAACPNESPAVDLTAAPEITIAPTQQSPTFIENTPSPPGEESDFNDFIAILEEMVTGGNTSPASNGQEAAGGMAATTLLTAWILINLLTSGGSIQDILADLLGLGTRHPPSGSQAQAQMSPPPNLSTSGHT